MIAAIQMQNLSYFYGKKCALNDLSFQIFSNDCVALIGRNGAGKSTILKIIAGLIPIFNESLLLNGIAPSRHVQRAKGLIGFLGEHAPLHQDVTVEKYLKYCGTLRGLRGKTLNLRLSEVIDICKLSHVQKNHIGQLSAGFAQRVGIAQAILHDPKILLLDEPTARLDPQQIQEFRHLIREISEGRTIVLATHLLNDVTAICNRVLLLDQGSLTLDTQVEHFMTQNPMGELEIVFHNPPTLTELQIIPGVQDVRSIMDNRFRVTCKDRHQALNQIVMVAVEKNWQLKDIVQTENSLSQLFAGDKK